MVAAITAAGVLVGRGVFPSGAGWSGNPGSSNYVPYAVVYPSPGVADGNTAEPLEYLDYSGQINCFGVTQDQAVQVADTVRGALIGRRLTVVGRSTYPVTSPGGPPVRPDNSVVPPVHMATVEIAFRSQAVPS
ncbi:hypothetical protein ABT340_39635 [Streptosporangium sp. NPDC000239]|uniref:hypothetical protein n=1 Tax=Streptosporangium sp. NPDC000239 TaxID=3154248 RepID=UPI00331DB877